MNEEPNKPDNTAVLKAAQSIKTYVRHGKRANRIPYGAEQPEGQAYDLQCRDCGVVKGQLHYPGCAVEECPVCEGQAAFCEIMEEIIKLHKAKGNG